MSDLEKSYQQWLDETQRYGSDHRKAFEAGWASGRENYRITEEPHNNQLAHQEGYSQARKIIMARLPKQEPHEPLRNEDWEAGWNDAIEEITKAICTQDHIPDAG